MSPTPRPSIASHLLIAALSAAIGGVIGFVLQSGPPLPDPSRDASLAAVERSLAELSQKMDELRARQAAPASDYPATPTVSRTEVSSGAEARVAETIERLEQLVRDLATSGSLGAAERLRTARLQKPVIDVAAATELHQRLADATEEQGAELQREWIFRDMADVIARLGSPTGLENQLGKDRLGWTYALPDGESFTIWFRDGLVVYVQG